ncbi:hypothetical protein [Deinococcus radiotolerans]|uniref:Portal protein n=1 Tax=Deinococcus radiotolerans TaxID=1309407 RepID=A0ABQ2FRS9_9DEIO|nr:hypothetical protein [Deinococcus radiotolerans]GGL20548.1 hypothetical protein GCM10010844_44240 [Deinococcus radiotolerans]
MAEWYETFATWFGKLLEGARGARLQDWAEAISVNEDDNEPGGYVSISSPRYFMSTYRMGLDYGIPIITGTIKMRSEATGQNLERTILSTPANATAVAPRNYVAGPVGGLILAPYSSTEITLQIALQFLPTQNLVKETLGLITEVTAGIPTAQASLPFLKILSASMDTLSSILTLGQKEIQLMGRYQVQMDNIGKRPKMLIWVAPDIDDHGVVRNKLDKNKFKYDASSEELYYDDKIYRGSAWIIIEFNYISEHPSLTELPVYRESVAKLRKALLTTTESATVQQLKGLLNRTLILIDDSIDAAEYLIASDREKLRGKLYEIADNLATKYNLIPLTSTDTGRPMEELGVPALGTLEVKTIHPSETHRMMKYMYIAQTPDGPADDEELDVAQLYKDIELLTTMIDRPSEDFRSQVTVIALA